MKTQILSRNTDATRPNTRADRQPNWRDIESMFQALIEDNENRAQHGLPTFTPSYELAEKALRNKIR